MYVLNMYFLNRRFFLELYNVTDNGSELLDKVDFNDASKNLLVRIDDILSKHQLNMNLLDKINTIAGPGSFSSIRIAYSCVQAFDRVFKNLTCTSLYLHELFDDHQNLLIALNSNIFLHYTDSWNTVFKKDLSSNLEYKTLEHYDLPINQKMVGDKVGEYMLQKADAIIRKPLYVYMPV